MGRYDAHVFAGHGREPVGEFFTVPEGTDLLLPDLSRYGGALKDDWGVILETTGEISTRERGYFDGAVTPESGSSA